MVKTLSIDISTIPEKIEYCTANFRYTYEFRASNVKVLRSSKVKEYTDITSFSLFKLVVF